MVIQRYIVKINGALIRLLMILILILGQASCSEATHPVITSVSVEEMVVITFADDKFNQNLYDPLMEEFQKQHPGIRVQFVALPEGGNEAPIDHYRMLASTADVSLVIPGSPEVSAYFRDLGPMIDSDPSFKPDDFWPGALTACQDAKGSLRGIPVHLFLTGIFYDEQAFAAAGLMPPKPGWTWDDFRQDATALTKQEGGVIRYGYADPPFPSSSLLASLVVSSLTATGGEIDAQALVKVTQWYLDLAKAKIVYPITGFDNLQTANNQWEALFMTNERPAMWSGTLASFIPGASVNFAISEYGFAPFPIEADGSNSYTTPLLAQCAVVSAASLHPDAAWIWINFLSKQWLIQEKNQLNELAKIPARQSVTEGVSYWDHIPAELQPAVRFGLKHSYNIGPYLSALRAVDEALEKSASSQADFASVLAEIHPGLAAVPQPASNTVDIVVATPQPTRNSPADATYINFFMAYQTDESDALEKLVEQFNQMNPDIVVKVSTDYPASRGEGPYVSLSRSFDCFIGQNDPSGAAASGQILGLNTFLEDETASFQQDFDQSLINAFRYEGELYDLPLVTQPTLISYNADLLARRGLQPPSNDWAFDDFVHLIQAAASISEADKSYGFIPSGYVDGYGLLLAGRITHPWIDFTANLPVVEFDTLDMANALTWLADLSKSGALYYDTTVGAAVQWPNLSNTFASGQVAFWFSRPGETDGAGIFMSPGDEPSFKVGVAPLPVMPASSGSFGGSYDRGLYISRQAMNPQACWMWIKFLSEQPNAFDGVPVRKSVADSPDWEARVGIKAADVYRLAATRVKREEGYVISYQNNLTIQWPLENWLDQALDVTLIGNDPRQALADAQRKADAYLACMRAMEPLNLSSVDLIDRVKTCASQADPEGNWGS